MKISKFKIHVNDTLWQGDGTCLFSFEKEERVDVWITVDKYHILDFGAHSYNQIVEVNGKESLTSVSLNKHHFVWGHL